MLANRVQHTPEGRPYLSSEMTSTDQRVARVSWFIEGSRLLNAWVTTSAKITPEWKQMAQALPFTVALSPGPHAPE